IGCDDAADPAVEPLGLAGDEVVGGLAAFFRIAPVDLEVGRIGTPENLRPVLAGGPAGAVFLDVGQAAREFESGARIDAAREILERLLRRVDELDLTARAALERFLGRDPDVVDRFARIVRALLAFGRERDEEARVEAPRASRRRDPVAEVREISRG